GAAPALDDPRDLAGARRAARLALAAVDVEAAGEIAELAVGAGVVAQGRTAVAERLLEYLADRRHQPGEGRARDLAGGLSRVDPRAEQRLADVDVAQTGDHMLVEQEQLHRLFPFPKRLVQIVHREVGAERLRTHRRERRPFI